MLTICQFIDPNKGGSIHVAFSANSCIQVDQFIWRRGGSIVLVEYLSKWYIYHGGRQSMSRKGDCWDNAVAESFFHTLKTELIYHHKFASREEAKQAIFDYIEVFYNRIRIHSANDYLSPVDYEIIHNAA